MKVPEQLEFFVNARLPQKTTTASLEGKTCVLTGATSGVGYYAARRLAQGGASLSLVARNPEKAERVQEELVREFGVDVDTVIADFTRLDEVRAAAGTLLTRHPRIDVLINDAGVHCTTRTLTEGGTETAFCVNHLASFLLARLLLDRLRESAPSRIIQVNSEGHRFGGLDIDDLDWEKRRYRGIKGYGASKTAQLLTVWELARRLEGTGVTINAVHPGAVKSNIGQNNGWLYRTYSSLIVNRFLKDTAIAGEALYYHAASPEMQNVSGRFFNLTIDEKPAPHALDADMGKRVWEITEQLVGITP